MAAQETKISDVFDPTNEKKKVKLTVRILGEVKESEFVISDTSGYCNLLVESQKATHLKHIFKKNTIKILNPKIDAKKKTITIHHASSVFQTKSIENFIKPPYFCDDSGASSSSNAKGTIPSEVAKAKKLSELENVALNKVTNLANLNIALLVNSFKQFNFF